ncbi:plasmid mobilization relaxosome protein MobC [Larkinella insperata]|uniref:Plasmid mobilization relaxosome protein MobC n=1 Tax=Larkinella insperata TaxID=332158 RepID=A0ABW3QEF2_9BACT
MFFVPQNGLLSLLTSQKMENTDPKAAKPKGGRPKKTEEDKRSKAIQVRLRPASYQYIQTLAEARNTSMANVIRDLCNGDVTVITPEQEALLRQIATMANNLNQLARKAHSEGFALAEKMVWRRCQELDELLYLYSK